MNLWSPTASATQPQPRPMTPISRSSGRWKTQAEQRPRQRHRRRRHSVRPRRGPQEPRHRILSSRSSIPGCSRPTPTSSPIYGKIPRKTRTVTPATFMESTRRAMPPAPAIRTTTKAMELTCQAFSEPSAITATPSRGSHGRFRSWPSSFSIPRAMARLRMRSPASILRFRTVRISSTLVLAVRGYSPI